MPYNRYTYDDLTAQINVLSLLACECVPKFNDLDNATRKAKLLIGSRIRTEIDRLDRHRRKMKRDASHPDTSATIELPIETNPPRALPRKG